MKNALAIVQEFFPNVTSVKDAKEDIIVEVTKRDSNSAQVRNHKACAMAVACKRKMQAEGVIVAVSTAYVINGTKAERYKLPESVSREVVSFDRIGVKAGGGTPKTGNGKKVKYHHTTGIRTVLGSKLQ